MRPDVKAGRETIYSFFATLLLVTGCTSMSADSRGAGQLSGLEKIRHVIVIYQENWSFDGLYGKFPGAEGLANAGERIRQVKKDGTPYTALPQPLDTSKRPPAPDARFPPDLPVAPYDAARYVPPDSKTGDIVNRASQEQRQINGGRMDGFVAWSEPRFLAGPAFSCTFAREVPTVRAPLTRSFIARVGYAYCTALAVSMCRTRTAEGLPHPPTGHAHDMR